MVVRIANIGPESSLTQHQLRFFTPKFTQSPSTKATFAKSLMKNQSHKALTCL